MREWLAPSPGASPVRRFPVGMVTSWAAIALYEALALGGRLGDGRPALYAVMVYLPLHQLLIEAAFFWARGRTGRAFGVWRFLFPGDVLLLSLAAYTDPGTFSPIPALSAIPIYTAAAMFRAPYVAGVSAFAVLAAFAADIASHEDLARIANGSTLVLAAAIAVMGIGAVLRVRGDEESRLALLRANEHEAEQAKALRAALATSRSALDRFVAFADHAPAAIIVVDRKRKVVFVNRGIERLTGVPPDRVLGVDIGSVLSNEWESVRIADDGPQRLRWALDRGMGGGVHVVETSIRSEDGTIAPVRASVFGIPEGAGLIFEDLSLSDSLQRQVMRAQQLETLGTLAGGVAHDFNNHLQAIMGNIELALLDEVDEAEGRRALEDALLAGTRSATVVRQLLEYGKPALDVVEVLDVAELVEETVRLARPGLESVVQVVIEPGQEHLAIRGNLSRLEQVLLNLLLNARDASPAGGSVTVGWRDVARDYGQATTQRPAGRYCAISVGDEGTGMSADVRDRIFDPFFTTKPVGEGSGLGLPTANNIVAAHGGWIDVVSEPGQGSTFSVYLPIAIPEAPSPGRPGHVD